MTPKDWALLAKEAYTSVPDLGEESSAGRIKFNMKEEGLVLAIPGTNNVECVLADVDAFPLDVGACGHVHAGIWNAFDPVWNDVSKLDIYALVGHSEGALGALFLGARLCLMGKAPKVIWAWEPPRASIDSCLADIFFHYNVEVHIMWHGNDCVPTVPLFFRHPGQVTRFGHASLPIINIGDHLMDSIIADL